MNCNFGRFELHQTRARDGWYLTRNGEPMHGIWATCDEARAWLRQHLSWLFDQL